MSTSVKENAAVSNGQPLGRYGDGVTSIVLSLSKNGQRTANLKAEYCWMARFF